VLLIAAYEVVAAEGLPTLHPHLDAQTALFAPILYPLAVGAGIAAREMIDRGARAEALLRERTEALSTERARVRIAHELHDSLAKSVEGLAMTASVLPSRCRRSPDAAAELAKELAADAQQAALEARMLMADLRPEAAAPLPVGEALRRRAQALAERSGVELEFEERSGAGAATLPPQRMHELTRIVGEAVSNAVTHGGAARVEVSLDNDPQGELVVSVSDDGQGLPEVVDLERLKASGHFGLAGMYERALAIGGRIRIQRRERGTAVSVRLPLRDQDGAQATASPAGARRWRLPRRRSTTRQPVASGEGT
jgi:signal transduction histidine kinase